MSVISCHICSLMLFRGWCVNASFWNKRLISRCAFELKWTLGICALQQASSTKKKSESWSQERKKESALSQKQLSVVKQWEKETKRPNIVRLQQIKGLDYTLCAVASSFQSLLILGVIYHTNTLLASDLYFKWHSYEMEFCFTRVDDGQVPHVLEKLEDGGVVPRVQSVAVYSQVELKPAGVGVVGHVLQLQGDVGQSYGLFVDLHVSEDFRKQKGIRRI